MFYGGYIYTLPDKVFQEAEKDYELLQAHKALQETEQRVRELRKLRNEAWGRAMIKSAGDLNQYEKRKM